MRMAAMLAIAGALALTPAAAQAPVSVAAFDTIELRGGGRVTVRHGPEQRVTLVSGNRETTRFSVDGQGRLRIDACVRSCRDYRLEVEIVTPELDGVAVEGGGSVHAEGRFPAHRALAVAVTGGGSADLTAIESASVVAAIRRGGSIRAHARDTLVAGINGGGSIRYLGDPSVTSAVRDGGSVQPLP